MPPSSVERRRQRNALHFTRALILLFTFQIWFVISETNVEGSDGNKEALLQQASTISGKLPPGKFNKKEVTVLAYNYPPMFTYKKLKEGNYTFDGVFKHHLEYTLEYLNMSIKYVVIDPAKVSKHGLFTAVFQVLDNKEVDFTPVLYYQSLENTKHMELVVPIAMNFFTLLQPYPEEESRLDVTIKPFQLPVWLSFLATTAVFVSVSAIIIKNRMDIYDSNLNRQSIGKAIYNQIDYVIRLFTNQGSSGSHARTRSSFKILTGIWLLTMVVLINAYSGVLTSLLTAPRLKPIAQTLKDVAESPELRVSCEKQSYFSNIFLNATVGYEKILGDQLRKEPTLLVSDGLGALENVIRKKAAYPGTADFNNYFMKVDKRRNAHCRLAISPELRNYPSMAIQFALPIGSPYAEIYSKVELLLWANGLVDYGRRTFKLTANECRVDKPLEAKTRTLTLLDLSAAFFILGVGLLLSSFCFLLEIVAKYFFIFAWGGVRPL